MGPSRQFFVVAFLPFQKRTWPMAIEWRNLSEKKVFIQPSSLGSKLWTNQRFLLPLLTFACGSNLGYIPVGDRIFGDMFCPPKFLPSLRGTGKSIKPSALQLFDRWLWEGGTGGVGRSCMSKNSTPRGIWKVSKKKQRHDCGWLSVENLSRYLQHGWCFLIVFSIPKLQFCEFPILELQIGPLCTSFSYVTEKAVS